MNNPSPVPPASDFVANLVNNRGNISESIPLPLSLIRTITYPSSAFSTVVIIVPSFVNLQINESVVPIMVTLHTYTIMTNKSCD